MTITILEGLTNVMHLPKNFHSSCARHRDMVRTVPNTIMPAYLGAEPASCPGNGPGDRSDTARLLMKIDGRQNIR